MVFGLQSNLPGVWTCMYVDFLTNAVLYWITLHCLFMSIFNFFLPENCAFVLLPKLSSSSFSSSTHCKVSLSSSANIYIPSVFLKLCGLVVMLPCL